MLPTCNDLPYYTVIILIRWAADHAAALQKNRWRCRLGCSSAYMVILDGLLCLCSVLIETVSAVKAVAKQVAQWHSGTVIWPSQALDSGALSWLRTLVVQVESAFSTGTERLCLITAWHSGIFWTLIRVQKP